MLFSPVFHHKRHINIIFVDKIMIKIIKSAKLNK